MFDSLHPLPETDLYLALFTLPQLFEGSKSPFDHFREWKLFVSQHPEQCLMFKCIHTMNLHGHVGIDEIDPEDLRQCRSCDGVEYCWQVRSNERGIIFLRAVPSSSKRPPGFALAGRK